MNFSRDRFALFVSCVLLLGLLTACASSAAEPNVVQAPTATASAKIVVEAETEMPATETAVSTTMPESDATETTIPSPVPTDTPEAEVEETYLPSESVFTLVSTEPIIAHGPEEAWDSENISAGPIVFHDGVYHMLQNALTGWPPSAGGTAYSTSEDGYSWNRIGDDSVFSAEDIDGKHVPFASAALVQPDGTWVMYFNTWPLRAVSHRTEIYRATAPTPSGPWTADREPVLKGGALGSWDAGGVGAPSVVQTEDGFVMYYTGGEFAQSKIGRATSSDGIHWEKYDDPTTTDRKYEESDPVLHPNEDVRAWDGGTTMNPDVIQTMDGWVMVYNSRASRGQRTGYALSEDGIVWQRSEAPIIDIEEIPNSVGSFGPIIRFIDGTYHLFVEIGGGGNTNVYLATHEGSLRP